MASRACRCLVLSEGQVFNIGIAGASCAIFSFWRGWLFFVSFYLRYTQRAHCDRSEQRATVLLQVGWSLGVMEVGQAKYMGVLPLPVCGSRWWVQSLCCGWKPWNQWPRSGMEGRKERGKQSAVWHWASLTCRSTLQTKDISYKQQTSSLYHSCSLLWAVLIQPHRVHFFFLPYSVWLMWQGSKRNSWSRAGVSLSTDLFCITCTFSWTYGWWRRGCCCYCRVQPGLLPCPFHPARKDSRTTREVPCTEPHLFLLCFLTQNPAPSDYDNDDENNNNKKRANAFFTFLDNFQSNVSLLSLDWRQYNSCMGLSQAPVSFLPDSFRLLYEMYARLHTDTIAQGDSTTSPWGCGLVLKVKLEALLHTSRWETPTHGPRKLKWGIPTESELSILWYGPVETVPG